MRLVLSRWVTAFVFFVGVLWGLVLWADPVSVRHREGLLHAFLVLQSMDGRRLADGESTQVTSGDRITSRVVFRFLDGSLYDDTTVLSQRGTFQLISDHSIQEGPSFKQAMDVNLDAANSQVTLHYEENGKTKDLVEHLDLPNDVVNGFLFTVLKNLPANTIETTVSYVAASPKPRIVKLKIERQSPEPFWIGRLKHSATHYMIKVQLGGAAGVVAPILGKQPPDTNVWVLEGSAPGIIKTEGPLSGDGPVWRIQQSNGPVFRALQSERQTSNGRTSTRP